MKQILLLFLVFLIKNNAYTQYSYTRSEDILKNKLRGSTFYTRNAESDAFVLAQADSALFSTDCFMTKYYFFNREVGTGKIVEDYRDSITYNNGKLAERTRFRKDGSRSVISFVQSTPSNQEQYFTKTYNASGTLVIDTKSTIYRNVGGKDSIFNSDALNNGTVVYNAASDTFRYDYNNRITEALYGYFDGSGSSFVYTPIYKLNYTYVGNNLSTRTYTAYNGSGSTAVVLNIQKQDFYYDAADNNNIVFNSYWNNSFTDNSFAFTSRVRYTSFNAKKRPLESFTDIWSSGTWVETTRQTFTYAKDSLITQVLTYNKTGSNWWVYQKYDAQFCGITTAVDDKIALDFKVYPNPTSEFLNIDFEDFTANKTNLAVFTTEGVQVLQKSNVSMPYQLDVSTLSNGFYFIKIIDGDNKVGVKRFVVTR